MFISDKASKRRLQEAENARRNRLEIVKAVSTGQITRRDVFKWGLFTTTGLIAAKNGLSLYSRSAFAAVPTGTPRSPTNGVVKFTMPMRRPELQKPIPLTMVNNEAVWGGRGAGERNAKKFSYHNDFSANPADPAFINPVTHEGPAEGRPPGEFFAHQRWEEVPPQVGYLLSLGQVQAGSRFYVDPTKGAGLQPFPEQQPNAVWSFGTRTANLAGNENGTRTGSLQPPLIKARYGEPIVTRIYNDLPKAREANGGFGRNEISTHYHNAHNGAESDGACNAYHFPGTFYDYHWSSAMARRDMPEIWPRTIKDFDLKASAPSDIPGEVNPVPGDFREIQGTMWFHDHRFFFTAENVHKGNFGLVNMYSGVDRGCETPDKAGVNLRLPSGDKLKQGWGNLDFDVNLAVSNPAFDQQGQLFFDIFNTDGFLGDILAVNGAYYPFFEVLPRRYRFRILNASMSRFIKLAIGVTNAKAFSTGTKVPFYFIANDGNLVVNPIRLTELDEQGVAERYDIIVDFSAFTPGDKLQLVNLLQQTDGRKPDGAVSMGQALQGVAADPAVGGILEFRVVNSLRSYDDDTFTYQEVKGVRNWTDNSTDVSTADWQPGGTKTLTVQIPVVAPVRERVIEFVRGNGDSNKTPDGQCIPDCGTTEAFPWGVKVNGQAMHSLNANRISALIPKPGEVEHWTLVNGGGGWDHPIHLHFEEGVTMNRGGQTIPETERLVRKDVWRLRPAGQVKFQVRFGEFGGSYVNHCHNTVHEDFAMLLRYQLLTEPPFLADGVTPNPAYHNQPQFVPTSTPIPSAKGVTWKTPEILPEGNPATQLFQKTQPTSGKA